MLQNSLYIVVIRRWFNTLMHSGEAKSHIINIEISITVIFPIYNLHSTTLIFFTSFVYNKKITS